MGRTRPGGLGECHEPETHLIPIALEAAAGLRPELVLYGTDYPTRDGTCIRDYVHVCDLADAHVRALEALLAGGPGGLYNLGTGRGRSNREVLDAVGASSGARAVARGPRRDGDPAELVADASRFRRDFGWRARPLRPRHDPAYGVELAPQLEGNPGDPRRTAKRGRRLVFSDPPAGWS